MPPTSLPAPSEMLKANPALWVTKDFKPGRPGLDHFLALPPGPLFQSAGAQVGLIGLAGRFWQWGGDPPLLSWT